jgi:hypothetical protein
MRALVEVSPLIILDSNPTNCHWGFDLTQAQAVKEQASIENAVHDFPLSLK